MKKSAPEVLCMGEILIDFVASPSGQKLVESETFVRKPGGAPANVAVGLSRLGRPSAFIGMVGDDAFGDFLRQTLENEEVDVSLLSVTEEQPTTLAFVALDKNGVPSFSFYRHPGADLSIRPEDIQSKLFETAKLFHFGSLSLVQDPGRETTYHCLDLAESMNLPVSYDPNYRPALWASESAAIESMCAPLDRVDLLKVSEEELLLLTGETDLEKACRKIASRGPEILVVTLGAEGLFGWTPDFSERVPGV
ncbi:MAG: carbohydrate kinase, partial [Candidatus Omnitrophica bacterium]|nr:carbohydrate kinase [Candidatus Omnitrophota bacterium]